MRNKATARFAVFCSAVLLVGTACGGEWDEAVSAQESLDAATLNGVSFASNPTASSLLIPSPKGTGPGQVLVAAVSVRGSPSVTPPSGWERIRSDAMGSTMKQELFLRVATSGEPSSYRWTFSSSKAASGAILAYDGVDLSAPILAHSGTLTTSNTSEVTARSVQLSEGGARLIGFFGIATGATLSPPDAMTELGETRSTAGEYHVSLEAADALQVAAGSSGDKIALASKKKANIGQLLALRPAPPAADRDAGVSEDNGGTSPGDAGEPLPADAGTSSDGGTPSGPLPPDRPAPLAIWIGKAELDSLPMSGSAWTGSGELKDTADATWTVQGIEVQSGQRFNVQALAGALVFARLYPDPSAEAYRAKVATAIAAVMAVPDDLGSSVTAPNRFLGTWAIAADLINLAHHEPALDAQFRAWLEHKLDLPYASGKTVRTQIGHANNQGSWATFSVAAASAYLGDRVTLDKLALRYRRWLGDITAPYALKWTDDQSFQLEPSQSARWVGINPRGATRDGHRFDGIQPSDQNRGSPMLYDPASFPNDFSSVRYNETSLHGVLGAILILHRAGYTELVGASDRAVLRAADWIKYAADTFPAKGYVYFTGPHEAARPLINYLYPDAGLPGGRDRSQLAGSAYGYAWTYWTHAGRRLQ